MLYAFICKPRSKSGLPRGFFLRSSYVSVLRKESFLVFFNMLYLKERVT